MSKIEKDKLSTDMNIEKKVDVEKSADKTENKPKKTKKQKGIPFYKKPGFRYSMLASVLSIVFIVVIVAVNILASMLDSRISSLQLDMTSTRDYSISNENAEYIKKIDKDITVTVAATEDYYISSYNSFLANNYYINDSTGGKYFNQTIQLLKKYPKINNKIKVQFIDPTTPAFDDYSKNYSGLYTYGSFIVECSFVNSEGKNQSRHKILQAEDLYQTDSESSSSSYYGQSSNITGSKVEQALTSALYYVSSEQQDKAAVLTGYGCDSADNLQTLLKDNNYDIEEIDSLTTSNIPDDVKLLIIAAPTSDFTPSEIKKLDDYMQGSEKLGKNIIYVASSFQHALTNLDSFLNEWGIKFSEGTVYETNSKYRSADSGTFMILQDGGTDYTSDNSNGNYICKDMRPISMSFEKSSDGAYYTSTSYYVYPIVKTFESTTVMPRGAKDSWTPESDAVTQEYTAMALSIYAGGANENDKVMQSCILTLASLDFYNSQYSSYYGNANQSTLLSVVNNMVGRQEDTYSVTTKVINTSTFTVSEIQANIIKYAVEIVVPVVTLVVCVIVVIRRKRK